MAFSKITYTHSGQTTFAIDFTLGYLSEDHVTARVNEEVDGSGDPVYRTITFITAGTCSISGTWESGDTVVFQRTTPKDVLQHDYSDGELITENNLDESNLQSIMVCHEALDGRLSTFESELDMGNHKIVNLATGVADTDAATVAQLNSTITETTALKDATEAFRDEASGFSTSAESSKDTAVASAVSSAADAVSTAADVLSTNADAVSTAADAVSTAGDRVQTGLDAVSTAADRVQTGLDATATAADAVSTSADASSTAADAVQTGLDVVATAADAVTTGNNATSSSSNASSAAASAIEAASSAAEGMYNDVVQKVFADSPIVPLGSEEGTLFRVDTSGGNVVVNLSALSVYAEDMKFAFVKVTSDSNTITINRGGSDTIQGSNSVVLSSQWEVNMLIGDSATGSWVNSIQSASVADGSLTLSKVVDITTDSFLGRDTAGTGSPEVISASQARSILGVESGATADQTGAEIKVAYEGESNTNAFTDAEQTKLAGVSTGAEVNPSVVSQVDAEAGTSTVEHIWTAERVKQAIAALGGGSEMRTGTITFASSNDSTTASQTFSSAMSSAPRVLLTRADSTSASSTAMVTSSSTTGFNAKIGNYANSGGCTVWNYLAVIE